MAVEAASNDDDATPGPSAAAEAAYYDRCRCCSSTRLPSSSAFAAAASATSAASDSSRCTPPSKHHRRLHPPDRRSLSLSLYSTTKLEMRLTDAYFHHFPAWLLPADSRHLQKRHRRRKRSRPARLRPHDLIASDFPSSSTVPSASSHSSNSSAKPVSASCTPRPVPHHRPKSTSPSHLLSSEQPHAAWSLPRWPRNWMAVACVSWSLLALPVSASRSSSTQEASGQIIASFDLSPDSAGSYLHIRTSANPASCSAMFSYVEDDSYHYSCMSQKYFFLYNDWAPSGQRFAFNPAKKSLAGAEMASRMQSALDALDTDGEGTNSGRAGSRASSSLPPPKGFLKVSVDLASGNVGLEANEVRCSSLEDFQESQIVGRIDGPMYGLVSACNALYPQEKFSGSYSYPADPVQVSASPFNDPAVSCESPPCESRRQLTAASNTNANLQDDASSRLSTPSVPQHSLGREPRARLQNPSQRGVSNFRTSGAIEVVDSFRLSKSEAVDPFRLNYGSKSVGHAPQPIVFNDDSTPASAGSVGELSQVSGVATDDAAPAPNATTTPIGAPSASKPSSPAAPATAEPFPPKPPNPSTNPIQFEGEFGGRPVADAGRSEINGQTANDRLIAFGDDGSGDGGDGEDDDEDDDDGDESWSSAALLSAQKVSGPPLYRAVRWPAASARHHIASASARLERIAYRGVAFYTEPIAVVAHGGGGGGGAVAARMVGRDADVELPAVHRSAKGGRSPYLGASWVGSTRSEDARAGGGGRPGRAGDSAKADVPSRSMYRGSQWHAGGEFENGK